MRGVTPAPELHPALLPGGIIGPARAYNYRRADAVSILGLQHEQTSINDGENQQGVAPRDHSSGRSKSMGAPDGSQ